MIQVRELHKAFGTINALQGITFTAPDGQITGLLGPNGAGKTTTLRILYTILKPDKGTATVDGYNVTQDIQAVRRHIGVLPENHGIYPRLTTRENIRYYGRLHEIEANLLEQRIDHLIELLEIQDLAERRVEGFSHGEQLKVAIARSLIHNPQNVLLDEPTNGLDVMSTRNMRTIIRNLRKEGKTVLFSSHVMQEVSTLCDHIVIINYGHVVGSGTPDALRSQTGEENLEDAFIKIIGSNAELIQ